MAFGYWVRRAFELPPRETARKAWALGLRRLREFGERRRDLTRETYSSASEGPLDWPCYLERPSLASLEPRRAEITALSGHAVRHEFDLLGSGWCSVARTPPRTAASMPGRAHFDEQGAWLRNVVNRANLRCSQRIWQSIEGDYHPIDWEVDFKSGVRWQVSEWSPRLSTFVTGGGGAGISGGIGADIKVPWELSRMQHLNWLWAAAELAQGNAASSVGEVDRYAREFRNQISDFIALNPPRYGVNWMCAMDVAIRAVGWVTSFDLWRQSGVILSDRWQRSFRASLMDHGRFIATQLEWDPHVRGNHYLTNLCGLIVLCAYLPVTSETNDWLTFSTAELYRETTLQFAGDGGNFEMSTGYHRLSAEMVTLSTAILARLSPERRARLESPKPPDPRRFRVGVPMPDASRPLWPVPEEHRHRLARMGRFSSALRGTAGPMPAVGDDDSGRFVKILPRHHRMKVKEARQRFLHLAARDWPACRHGYWLEERQHDEVSRGVKALLAGSRETGGYPSTDWNESALLELAQAPSVVPAEGTDPGAVHWAFPATGFFVSSRPRYHAVVRAGDVGQNGNGGHAHNDQLSLLVKVDGDELFIDAGTYVYSANPEARNRFRSIALHNTLQVEGRETNVWAPGVGGLFRLPDRSEVQVERFDGQRFEGQHRGFGHECRRQIEFGETSIRGRDLYKEAVPLRVAFLLAPDVVVPSLDTGENREGPSRKRHAVEGTSIELRSSPSTDSTWSVRLSWPKGQAEFIPVESSPAYGELRETWQLAIVNDGPVVDWEIEFLP